MKKIFLSIVILGLIFIPGTAKTKKIGVSIGAGYNNYSGIVKEVYDGTNISYSLDLSYSFIKNLEIFIHSDIINMKGSLTHSGEPTNMKSFPLELGIRFPFGSKVSPYLGAGAGTYNFKESNIIGDWSGSGVGFFGEGGIKLNFSSLFFDIKAKYISLKIEGIDLSNMKLITAIGLSF